MTKRKGLETHTVEVPRGWVKHGLQWYVVQNLIAYYTEPTPVERVWNQGWMRWETVECNEMFGGNRYVAGLRTIPVEPDHEVTTYKPEMMYAGG